MEDTELCKLLEQLRTEIDQTETVDKKEMALLKELGADIDDLLERCDSEQLETHPLTLQRFEDAIDSMAVNHPTLTALIANVSNILSNAGI